MRITHYIDTHCYLSAKMCQLCTIKTIAARDRWPKPLEHYKADIDFLVSSAHDEWTSHQTKKQEKKDLPTTESLLEALRTLVTLLEQAENDRREWWTSPQKREQRRQLELDGNQRKLSDLHKVNNTTTERIEAMNARLGLFVKWTLGMNGGIWELQEGVKVASPT